MKLLTIAITFGLIASNICFAHPQYSNNPRKEKIFRLKSELRIKTNKHNELLNKFLRNNCPRDMTFSILQKVMYRKWVCDCTQLSEMINRSNEKIRLIDEQIMGLKRGTSSYKSEI